MGIKIKGNCLEVLPQVGVNFKVNLVACANSRIISSGYSRIVCSSNGRIVSGSYSGIVCSSNSVVSFSSACGFS